MTNDLSRRMFLARAGAITLGLGGLRTGLGSRAFAEVLHGGGSPWLAAGFGPLVRDPAGLLDLPAGFTYSILSPAGEPMDDGLVVPPLHDGMAAFPGSDGLTILVRNHEVEADMKAPGPWGVDGSLAAKIDRNKVFDPGTDAHGRPMPGGTTTVVYDTKSKEVVRHFMSLAGTERNCAGGPTPRNTWITCEETVALKDRKRARDHGWNFEVPATEHIHLADPTPITAMGRFNHEACATDPRSGAVYQTEDRHDGMIYRYLPNHPDKLLEGGRLQALAIEGRPGLDTRNWDRHRTVEVGEKLPVRWIDLENVDSPSDDLRFQGHAKGCARFARGEGMWLGRDGIYLCCTNGGSRQAGQIWRLVPSAFEGTPGETEKPGTIELFIEPNDPGVLENADNITVAPWGDLIVCEDGDGGDFLIGVTPEGKLYQLARNARNSSEFAGATFSPDGTTLFVNIQSLGITVAIVGDWGRRR